MTSGTNRDPPFDETTSVGEGESVKNGLVEDNLDESDASRMQSEGLSLIYRMQRVTDRLEREAGDLLENPQQRMDEFRALGSAAENVLAAQLFYEQQQSLDQPISRRGLTDSLSFAEEEDLTSRKSSSDRKFAGSEPKSIRSKTELAKFSLPVDQVGLVSSEGTGGLSPYLSQPYHDVGDSGVRASVFRGENDVSQSHFSAPHREESSSRLTPSNFVSNVGKYRLVGGRNTHDDLDHSLRKGRVSLENVTQRETKRPSTRPRDKEYHRRFSVGASSLQVVHLPPSVPSGGHPSWPRERPLLPPRNVGVEFEAPFTPPVRTDGVGRNGASRTGEAWQDAGTFYIRLICAGDTVEHLVWPTMPISVLIAEAGEVFGLDPSWISLVLFSMTPVTLRSESTISGPPLVAPGSSVMVFSHQPAPMAQPRVPPPPSQPAAVYGIVPYAAPQVGNLGNLSHSKLLSSFKLPKFDGVSKNWKTWDRAFQRFLGLHQLDHVLEDGFLATLWHVPGAKEANKFVYFLLEDSVSTGSLASKYIRQATKWNGHEAYVLLHDGYVFSGPQSATILLAELSQLRLKRDENASLFCMRLVELIEDLEAIPGDSAVYLTEQQKLGYLLSAIRHESSLQSVYSQLQSEQLRGLVSFDQACRELHFRCEAIRADEFLDSRPGKALISTERKKKGQEGQQQLDKLLCLKQGCPTLIPAYLPLCKVCYLELMAGKTVSVILRDKLGTATYNSGTKKIDFPSCIPESRFPKRGIKKKALLAQWKGLPCLEDRSGSSGDESSVKILFAASSISRSQFRTTQLVANGEDCPIAGEDELESDSNESNVVGNQIYDSSFDTHTLDDRRILVSTHSAASELDSTLFYIDSGAGQCLCSCDDAFINMSPCEIEITGVAGSLQIYGIGTALFVARDVNDCEVVLRIHNCLFSSGEFNLISVSQLCGKQENHVNLSIDSPSLHLMSSGHRRRAFTVPLHLDDGLFAVHFTSIQVDDPRYVHLPKCDVTPGGGFVLATSDMAHRWKSKVVHAASKSARILIAPRDYHWNLESFCSDFLAPPSLPPAKRTYSGTNLADLTDLSIRFFGVGTKRLVQTIAISNGLSSKASRKVVPTHVFPAGRWKESKTPRVSKGKLMNLHTASVGEVVFTDTFDSGDSKYKYGQVFYDYASGWGDIFPLRSRNEVGQSLSDFCCRNWIPLCLVSDNAGENTGGELVEVTRHLCIQRAYICPRHPMQNYAEGYLGRITAMASFAMVYAGAPLFMWIYSIKSAVFINNIAAKFYPPPKNVWAQPYQAVHGEVFADSSIVVPFGCGALILRDPDDRPKFRTKCSLMIFIHYADEHPMFTYAFFSPRTKRVLYRQDAIFLPTLFPMRVARQLSGLDVQGDALVTFRSPVSLRDGSPLELSFGDWCDSDALPDYEDDVTGFSLGSPSGPLVHEPREIPELPVHVPNHPGFPPSVVSVPIPASSALIPVSTDGTLVAPATNPSEKTTASELSSQSSGEFVDKRDSTDRPTGSLPDRSQDFSDKRDNLSSGGTNNSNAGSGGTRPRVRIGLTLTFPDSERDDQRYSGHPGWTVSHFKERMGRLLETTSPIVLHVSPDWEELDHLGLVSDRFLPDSTTPCPFLEQDSVVRVSQFLAVTGGIISCSSMSPGGEKEESSSFLSPGESTPKRLRTSSHLERGQGIRTESSAVDGESDGLDLNGVIRVSSTEKRILRAKFKTEAKRARSEFKEQLVQEWHNEYPSMGDKENLKGDRDSSYDEDDQAYDHFVSVRMEAHDNWAAEKKAAFVRSLKPLKTADPDQTSHAVQSRQDRTKALWEGLRRLYFGGSERESVLEDGHPPGTRISLQESNRVLRQEIAELMDRLRRRPRTSSPSSSPSPSTRFQDSDSDDPDLGGSSGDPQQGLPDVAESSRETIESTQPSRSAASSETQREEKPRGQRHSRRIQDLLERPHPETTSQIGGTAGIPRRQVKDRYFYEPVHEVSSTSQNTFLAKGSFGEVSDESLSLPSLGDKASVANQCNVSLDKDFGGVSPTNGMSSCLNVVDSFRSENEPGELGFGASPKQMVFLSQRTIRKVLAAKETLFKFGTFVPRNESEALRSPEAPRWIAGRDLEWLRMGQRETFERDWSWHRIQREFPNYKKSDIGHLFYVFDYKYSGEHRVRLVFDGSRQSPSTYSETYAPAARQESVRLFHIVLVEEGYFLGQYDVPQAFLLAPIDTDIFVYPPSGQSEYSGQILKLRKALYGGKQSAYLWFTMINAFILELGFTASPMDSCLYKRDDAILILYCDDLRIGASKAVLQSLQEAFFARFGITTAPGDRFLGMDTEYQRDKGYMKLSMTTYIHTTVSRFEKFDLSCGVPFRELVGCLLWITLCVLGPELLRVKDLARRSNCFTVSDYNDGLKVLKRIAERKLQGIVIFRNAASREVLPAYRRPSPDDPTPLADTGDLLGPLDQGEVTMQTLCQAKKVASLPSYVVPDNDGIEIPRVDLPVNIRYRLIAFGDASFAIGELKQSVSGWVLYLNGVPLLWGSLKQTIVVDSSCAAEFVAASIVTKQILNAENMIAFFGFSCPKPYRLYTDSMACLHIATNPAKLGNVRHLHIRYHLVRCVVSFGDIIMFFCVTEAMIADLFTKIVAGVQDQRLSIRFYSIMPESAGLVLGTSSLDPSTFDSRSSAFLYPGESASWVSLRSESSMD